MLVQGVPNIPIRVPVLSSVTSLNVANLKSGSTAKDVANLKSGSTAKAVVDAAANDNNAEDEWTEQLTAESELAGVGAAVLGNSSEVDPGTISSPSMVWRLPLLLFPRLP